MDSFAMLTPVILTWEYPPNIIGDLSHYVEGLASRLIDAKVPVRVVTCHDHGFQHEKKGELLDIYWASNPVKSQISVLTWCLSFNAEMERIVSDLYYEKPGDSYVLDVQDWHFVPAGVSLKRAHGIPFVFTLHSLEEQRSPGSTYALSSCIRGLEAMGILESDLIVVKNEQMRKLVIEGYKTPEEKVVAIQSGDPDEIKKTLNCYASAAHGGCG